MIKFTVTKTYDVISIESASRGDFSESGFVYEAKPMTLRELISEVKSLGYFENFQPMDSSQSLYQCDADIDYQSGDETREVLHIDGSPRFMRRLNRILGGIAK